MIKKTLGGDRLGSGNKMQVAMHNYERSTHDLSYAWRSSMSAGTIVPFMHELGLNGDTFDINLETFIRTIPTVGPLFGSFNYRLDVFVCPFRLYIGALHNNMLNVGNEMDKVKLPTMLVAGNPCQNPGDTELVGTAPDSLLNYLGIAGVGANGDEDANSLLIREFQAVKVLAYYDIFKYYLSNKQEENAYFISPRLVNRRIEQILVNGELKNLPTTPELYAGDSVEVLDETIDLNNTIVTGNVKFGGTGSMIFENMPFYQLIKKSGTRRTANAGSIIYDNIQQYVRTGMLNGAINAISISNISARGGNQIFEPQLVAFPLENIDKARIKILQNCEIGQYVTLGSSDENKGILFEPYASAVGEVALDPETNISRARNQFTQNGLVVGCYKSDLFNNWVSSEWVEQVNQASQIPVENGSFSMDALIIAKRVYNYRNRVAMSGGTYDDWQEVSYGEDAQKYSESPIYMGGMSGEITFDEVVSSAESGDNPLGTLGGRGTASQGKGGQLSIKIKEPSYIMGIVTITPRLDYSQGNKWDTYSIKTMEDLHKPEFDGIGFQDLIAEQMHWATTQIGNTPDRVAQKAIGKQPAWINYMTNVNRIHGDFARTNNAAYMVINRDYEIEYDKTSETGYNIKDMTTYIDPRKTNYLFAAKDFSVQPFWMQIGVGMHARRKMSAAIIPNL